MSNEVEASRLGGGMITVAWLLVLGLLWYFFNGYLERRDNPNRNLQVTATGESAELVLQRNRAGHYVLPGNINGQPVTFLLDTGATVVSVPAHLGSSLGLVPGARYQVRTANGEVTVSATTISALEIGPFRLLNVQGDLNPGMREDEVLLGMSVLRNMEFTQRGDLLILRLPSSH